MTQKIYLYSTTHCHLCELAQSLLDDSTACLVEVIEIAYDECLVIKYGTRIPVIKRQDTQAELDWPFNLGDIMQFLQN
ncbi:MAG: glutaredoxin family protein [Pseudomonadota bacterium]